MNNGNFSHMTYSGDASLKEHAERVARIINAAYRKNEVAEAGPDLFGVPSISIKINDKGFVDISCEQDPTFTKQTKGVGIILGTLMGIGLAKKKDVALDNKGMDSDAPFPTGASVKFGSFADLAECVNVLARSQDERIDVASLPRRR